MKNADINHLKQLLASANSKLVEMANENAKLKLEAFQRGENPIGKKDLDVDEFHELIQEPVGLASEHAASLFLGFAEKYDDNPELDDGEYEFIKDVMYAVTRMTARLLGNPLADMDKAFLHDIELPDDQRQERSFPEAKTEQTKLDNWMDVNGHHE